MRSFYRRASAGGAPAPRRPAARSATARLLVVFLALGLASCALIRLVAPSVPPRGEWPTHGGTNANARYSSLDQITRDNVRRLRVAWHWTSPDDELMARQPGIQTWLNEATPLMIGGVLYVSTSVSQVAAIDAISGRTLWVYDPQIWVHGTPANFGFVHRGVAYWTDGRDARILIGTGNGFLIALDARTGKPVTGFGVDGRVDLTEGLGRTVDRMWYTVTSPPLIVGDLVVVGSSIQSWPIRPDMPPGHIRAFDVRTGAQRWIFHSIPQAGEFGTDTWAGESWRTVGGVNVWTLMSADEELGYIYLPFSPAANDYYGGERHGDNLFADSLVCLEAATGRRVWHFQLVRHGVWDYDIPAAPNLVDIAIGGRRVRAVAQVTKQGFVYVFDRVTGRPLWPIEERPVPQSTVPDERTAPRQPFPTRPAPFERQDASPSDVIDFTPELREQALEILTRYDHGPLFTPPSERGTVLVPGVGGGASWTGAAFDPETGRLFVPSITAPNVVTLSAPSASSIKDRYVGRIQGLRGPQGLPLLKPPFGRLTAIDLSSGEHLWMVPIGEGPRHHPLLEPLRLGKLGWDRRSFPLATRTLLFVAQMGPAGRPQPAPDRPWVPIPRAVSDDPALQVFDKASGELVAKIELPENATGALMTYLAEGRQYIVVPIGGGAVRAELIALSLP
ncbi:MAG: pyrroloquinoline quinone-dependent dehydrogenase [Candidatus Rokuibacteriota bacterium]|nr:MAG: pyrroloquinoline quinone-dependent dehydrogenase [Candidatus Rokubacteria bacterium]